MKIDSKYRFPYLWVEEGVRKRTDDVDQKRLSLVQIIDIFETIF